MHSGPAELSRKEVIGVNSWTGNEITTSWG
jgi:hypothetical protein